MGEKKALTLVAPKVGENRAFLVVRTLGEKNPASVEGVSISGASHSSTLMVSFFLSIVFAVKVF